MSFTDQKARLATEADLQARWGGSTSGKRFRCYMCGHKFILGDVWRWVYGTDCRYGNFIVCGKCNSSNEDVLEFRRKQEDEADTRFWWIMRDE